MIFLGQAENNLNIWRWLTQSWELTAGMLKESKNKTLLENQAVEARAVQLVTPAQLICEALKENIIFNVIESLCWNISVFFYHIIYLVELYFLHYPSDWNIKN